MLLVERSGFGLNELLGRTTVVLAFGGVWHEEPECAVDDHSRASEGCHDHASYPEPRWNWSVLATNATDTDHHSVILRLGQLLKRQTHTIPFRPHSLVNPTC